MSNNTADYLRPFLASAKNILQTMAQTNITGEKCSVTSERKTYGTLTTIVPVKSETLSGNVIFSFEDSAILGIVGKMLMTEVSEINQEVIDTALEIMNMVSGNASSAFAGLGVAVELESPLVIQGKGEDIEQLSDCRLIEIPFTTDAGSFVVQTDLHQTK